MAVLLEGIARETREAARVRWEGPTELFVWRARRCAEAVVYGVLAQVGANVDELAKQRKGLDALLEHKQLEGHLSREMRAHLTALREFGNIAAHFQPSSGVSAESVGAVATHLAGLLREFYAMQGDGVSAESLSDLAVLTDPSACIEAPHEVEPAGMRRRSGAAQPLQHGSEAVSDSLPRSWFPRGVLVVSMLCAGLVGVLVGWSIRSHVGPADRTHDRPASVLSALPRLTEVRVMHPDASLGAGARAAPDASLGAGAHVQLGMAAPIVHERLRCDEGMLQVEGASGPFCIDSAPVLMGDYRRCVGARVCARPMGGFGCNWQNNANELAANCIPRHGAQTYCRWRHADRGALPTRDEWNRVSTGRHGIRLLPDTREWTADDVGENVAVVRGARRPIGFVWNTERGGLGFRDVSFRCVVRGTSFGPASP